MTLFFLYIFHLMNHLKLYKIFESQEETEDELSIRDLVFSHTTQDDIEDLFINLIDHQFSINIDFRIYEDAGDGSFAFSRSSFSSPARAYETAIIDLLSKGKLIGCYSITIELPPREDLTNSELAKWALLFAELKRISQKFEQVNFKCNMNIENGVFASNQKNNIEVKIFIKPTLDKAKMRKFISKKIDAEINGNKILEYRRVRDWVKSNLTKSIQIYWRSPEIDDKIYVILKPVSKQVINFNLKKLQNEIGYAYSQLVKSIKLANADELMQGVLKDEVDALWRLPESFKPPIIIEVELDMKKINARSLSGGDVDLLKKLLKKFS